MIDTGWMAFLVVVAETVSGSLANWANPGYAIDPSTDKATVNVPEGYPDKELSEVIKFLAPDYPFAIGPAASYNVDFRIKRSAGGGGHFIADEIVKVVVNGSLTGNNLAETGMKWSGSETVDYDGDWGIGFLQSMFNSDFGIALQVSDTDNGGTASIEMVWLRVQYEGSTGPAARELIQYS